MKDIRFPWEREPKKAEKYIESERLPWDKFFMNVSKTVGKQSTCLKKHVGAILVKNRRIISEGYNGLPAGIPHCKSCVRVDEDIQSYSQCQVVHAEINCIILCAKHGVSSEGSTLYCEYMPCAGCVGALINADVKEIVYEKPAVDEIAIPLAVRAGIKVRRIE